ncbi:hypothetical protein [uncultured Paraglaciecola sp.]|uniref:hypothetical protein n=1 Tax=uncultured Paraglaciecola sp. TaxID=1765024 RepID=UPI0026393CC7|nr:hypothetical protein [uncultured Paraglaciecola sp.]
MKLSRCPVCHHHITLESLVQDESGRELMALMSKLPTQVASSCLSYIALFRPAKSDLNNGRALRLMADIMAYNANHSALCQALDQTTVQIKQNRVQSGDSKPLSNHNYFKKVLTSIQGWDQTQGTSHALISAPAQSSKQSVSQALSNTTDTSWAK